MDICEKIAAKKAKDEAEKQAARNKNEQEFIEVVESLRSKLPRLREAHRIFRTLHDNGYGKYDDDMHMNHEQHYKKGYFLSDGWFHWPGFSLRTPGVFFTMGGGANRFSCGINIEIGVVVVGTREFDDADEPITDGDIRKMCVEGGTGWTFTGKGGYGMSGTEIIGKLKYCDKMADEFCDKVSEFANNLVK